MSTQGHSVAPKTMKRVHVIRQLDMFADELMQNWELARDRQPLRSIQGLM